MVTDNKASGFERIWREAVGGLINPVRGINRLISGETFRKFDNPDYYKPHNFLMKFTAGIRRLDNSQDESGDIFSKGKEQGIYSMDVVYGDPFDTPIPFSYLNFGIELTTGAPQLANMYSNGNLFGITLMERKGAKHKINFLLDYSYTNNPGFQYGQTSIVPSLMSIYDFFGSTKLITNVGINGVLMGGTNTDYFIGEDGRDYDLGPGLGVLANFQIRKGNWTFVELLYTNGWIFSMTEPQESTHNLNYVNLNLYLPLQKYFAVGLSASIYWRKSYYLGSPDVTKQVPVAKLFFSTTL
jgi:hypothetical protein